MSKWGRRMLGLVNLVATWSKVPSTGVGAVCDSDEALFDRDEKLRRTIHAEEYYRPAPVDQCAAAIRAQGNSAEGLV